MAEARSIARLNGRPGVSLEIQRQSGADIVGIARHVRAEVERIRESLPPGVEISVARDYAIYIEAQVRSVFEDMLIATGLVVIVVLFFLRNVRTTFIALLAIPSSVIGSFTLLLRAGSLAQRDDVDGALARHRAGDRRRHRGPGEHLSEDRGGRGAR